MLGVHFSAQNYIGSRWGLTAVWTISIADVPRRNIKGCCLQTGGSRWPPRKAYPQKEQPY